MGSYLTLSDFVHWGTKTYPADNMALVLWDHGAGWRNVRRAATLKRAAPRAFSQDDQSNDEIETWELPLALNSTSNPLAQPLDMIIWDCSLMQMIENAYEVSNSARVMVGSEESPPERAIPTTSGWPI